MKPMLDARAGRTRDAILGAFRELVFDRGFENVSVQAVVAGAGIARSTFYEHFSSREDLLRASMAHFFKVIAECSTSDSPPEQLTRVLGHFWENRRLTDAVFSGAPRRILAQSLSEMVETRLHEAHGGRPLLVPYRLASIQIAEAQLALVESWMRGRAFARVEDVAGALHRTSRASADALAS